MNKEKINLVWLKRDLRLHDNEAISRAIKNGKRFLIFYAFEKILINDPHYNSRHWNFIKQSLLDINSELKEHNSKHVLPFYITIMLFVLKFFYYQLPLLDTKTFNIINIFLA